MDGRQDRELRADFSNPAITSYSMWERKKVSLVKRGEDKRYNKDLQMMVGKGHGVINKGYECVCVITFYERVVNFPQVTILQIAI